MSESNRRYFTGQTLEQALLAAARHHQIPPEELGYREVPKRHGFVRIPRRLVIEVDPANPRGPRPARPAPAAGRPTPAPAAAARRAAPLPAPPLPRPEAPTPRGESRGEPPFRPVRAQVRTGEEVTAERALQSLIRLTGLELSAQIEQDAEGVRVELTGPGRDRLLAEEAEVLQAIEYLLPRLLRGGGEGPVCRVDSGGYRSGREEELQRLAKETADLVRRSGRPVSLAPLSPGERRVVHMTLAEDPEVRTESDGEGFFKRVTVSLRGPA
ncbi:MAG TPA: R3H domain-containing nucleic acid-binding protein [Thermoanaerobaculia bacterium]|nr:R3H domain-containing nucleic acid-binding protein [Thermoanaerobaculia bacterium]